MARRCEISGKAPGSGNLRSFSNRATRRRFLPNLITKKVLDKKTGKYVRMTIATSTLRTLLKQDRVAAKKAREVM